MIYRNVWGPKFGITRSKIQHSQKTIDAEAILKGLRFGDLVVVNTPWSPSWYGCPNETYGMGDQNRM